MVLVCGDPDSPLMRLARQFRYVELFPFDLPAGKDGFLATNSLVASAVFLYRAYSRACGIESKLPTCLGDLLDPGLVQDEYIRDLHARCDQLWHRDTTILLHGASTQVAALDIESRFAEAALGTTQVADYRNFAHGRHHWLGARGSTTGVLAFVTDEDRYIADKTLALVPDSIPVARLNIPHTNAKSGLAALVAALYVAGAAGAARGIDPGRPGVAGFGRRIYNLRGIQAPQRLRATGWAPATVAIRRKTGQTVEYLASEGHLVDWRRAHRAFTRRLHESPLRAVVFDYDGTLCDGRDRCGGVDEPLVSHLLRLLCAGTLVGVATGRGKSVRSALRQHLPTDLWSRVIVGYYNGSDIGPLGDDSHPDSVSPLCDALTSVVKALQDDAILSRRLTCTARSKQVTLEGLESSFMHEAHTIVEHIVRSTGGGALTVMRSGHSLDILASGVSKQALVDGIRDIGHGISNSEVLCIGDQGRWPGNDFVLLGNPLSLSVDQTSPDPRTCWHIAPIGHRGVQATLDYLRALKFSRGDLYLQPNSRADQER